MIILNEYNIKHIYDFMLHYMTEHCKNNIIFKYEKKRL